MGPLDIESRHVRYRGREVRKNEVMKVWRLATTDSYRAYAKSDCLRVQILAGGLIVSAITSMVWHQTALDKVLTEAIFGVIEVDGSCLLRTRAVCRLSSLAFLGARVSIELASSGT